MDTKAVLREQARIAKQLDVEYRDFREKFNEKSLTRSASADARQKLDDLLKAASENNDNLISRLDSRHEYFMREIFIGIRTTAEAFQELLNNPEFQEPSKEADTMLSEIGGDEGKTLSREELEAEIKRLNSDRRKLEDDRHTLNQLEDAVQKLENDRRQLEIDRRELDERRRDSFGSNERETAGRADLTKDLADLLYDIKKNREDDVEDFKDDPLQWLKFKNMFQLSVHNKRIPNLQKFSILVKKITGPKGKAVLDGIVYDPANYEDAWKAIIKQFHNQSQLVRIEIQEFGKLPTMNRSSDKGAILRELFNKTNRLITNLKSIFKEGGEFDDDKILAKGANAMIVYAIENSLDEYTKLQWGNARKDKRAVPTFQELLTFLEQRAANIEYYVDPAKEVAQSKEPPAATHGFHNQKNVRARTFMVNQKRPSTGRKCPVCKQGHDAAWCPDFKKMTLEKKWEFVLKNKICGNCLKHPYDRNRSCRATTSCNKCDGRHHSLMHRDKKNPETTFRKAFTAGGEDNHRVISPTAIINVEDINGRPHQLRALLDSGSDLSFISQKASNMLQLPVEKVATTVSGIGGSKQVFQGMVKLVARPMKPSNFALPVNAVVIKSIGYTTNKQTVNFKPKVARCLNFADSYQANERELDVLLGIPEITKILHGKTVPLGEKMIAINTKFGHVLCGSTTEDSIEKDKTLTSNCRYSSVSDWDSKMDAFWDIESSEDIDEGKQCEEFYAKTLKKLPGRYEVGIPFKSLEIGDSLPMAHARLHQVLKHLEKNKERAELYIQSMEEMITSGHMEKVKWSQVKNLLPHSGVYKPEHLTTRLRVVFDGSAKTANGRSLNDVMYTGPKLQSDICVVLLRFRMHTYIISADVTKMFRQIRVRPEDAAYQCVLWKQPNQDKVEVFRINVVVFGLASSPYLAIRTMNQVAEDEGEEFPLAKKIITENFYVDDVLASFNSVGEAKEAAHQLKTALGNRGFPLCKWVSNCDEVLMGIPEELKLQKIAKELNYDGIKALGFHYNFKTDSLHFKLQHDTSEILTKREVLSKIMGLYDPTGLLGPITFTIKIIMQDIWATNIGWDEVVPNNIAKRWVRFQSELPEINDLMINRCINFTASSIIIGFSDGSDRGYGSALYVRSKDTAGKITVSLLMSKSRVGHVKKPQTTPRMELMGAVLMAELIEKAKEAFNLSDNNQIWAFMDSQAVIAQLQMKDPDLKLKTFVANRVKFVQSRMETSKIFYIDTKQNPADKVTRGLMPSEIINDDLWWFGPLQIRDNTFEPQFTEFECKEELKTTRKSTLMVSTETEDSLDQLIRRTSSWNKLRRIVARMMRWRNKITGPISAAEIETAETRIIRSVQQNVFSYEYQKLQNSQQVKTGPLSSFTPFLDEQGLIRIRGRLQRSSLTTDAQHNIIIPKYVMPAKLQWYDNVGDITKMLILHAHHETMHGGAQQVQMYLNQRYRILNGHSAVRLILKRCVTCRRYDSPKTDQLMGMLPYTRVNQAHAFVHATVDYFGPMDMKASFLRTSKTMKCWGAVFVCSATKAIHLELVTELSSESYIAALKRFIGRRGVPKLIHSDNGKNFVGATKLLEHDLADFLKELRDEKFQAHIIEYCANLKIDFKFIPPYCPHVGGLWESGVKSAKRHLMKASGARIFTYEELQTLFIHAEAMLNSRPLVQTSKEDVDAEIITPGHFLTGRAINSLPAPDLQGINLVKRWRIVEQQAQNFWKVWSNDYLHDLQQRSKWRTQKENVQLGQIVLLKSDQMPKCHWNLGVITKIYPDEDGIVRIVDVSRGGKTDTRHVVRLCVLPITNCLSTGEMSSISLKKKGQGSTLNPEAKPFKLQSEYIRLRVRPVANPDVVIKTEPRSPVDSQATTRSNTPDPDYAQTPENEYFEKTKSGSGKAQKRSRSRPSKVKPIYQPTRRSSRLMNKAGLTLMALVVCLMITLAPATSLNNEQNPFNLKAKQFFATVQTTIIRNLTQTELRKHAEQSTTAPMWQHVPSPFSTDMIRTRRPNVSSTNRATTRSPQTASTATSYARNYAVTQTSGLINQSTAKIPPLRPCDTRKMSRKPMPPTTTVTSPRTRVFKTVQSRTRSTTQRSTSTTRQSLATTPRKIDDRIYFPIQHANRTYSYTIRQAMLPFFNAKTLQEISIPNVHPTITQAGSRIRPLHTHAPSSPSATAVNTINKLQQQESEVKKLPPAVTSTTTVTRTTKRRRQLAKTTVYNVTEGSLILANDDTIHQYFGTIKVEINTGINTTRDLGSIDDALTLMSETCGHMFKYKTVVDDHCGNKRARLELEANRAKDIIARYRDADDTTNDSSPKPSERVKRSSRGFLQSIVIWLIGGEEDFNDIREHEMKIDHEIDNFKQAHNSMAISEKSLEQAFHLMRIKVREMDQTAGSYSSQAQLQYTQLVYQAALHSLETTQRSYSELSNPIFSIPELHQIETQIHNNLPEGASLPKVKLQEILSISSKEVSLGTDQVIKIVFTIPVIHKEEYRAMRILATPKEGKILRLPPHRIAINEQKQTFFYLTPEIEMITLTNQIHIAKTTRIQKFESADQDCIANAILRHEARPACATELLKTPYTVFQQVTRNKYLFYTSNSNAGYIICPTSRTMIVAQIGLINITPGCSIDTGRETISVPIDGHIRYQSPDVYVMPETDLNFEVLSPRPTSTDDVDWRPSNVPQLPINNDTSFLKIEEHHVKYHIYAIWFIVLFLAVAFLGWRLYAWKQGNGLFNIPPIRMSDLTKEAKDDGAITAESFENIVESLKMSKLKPANQVTKIGSPKQNLRTFLNYDEPKLHCECIPVDGAGPSNIHEDTRNRSLKKNVVEAIHWPSLKFSKNQ